MKAKKIVDEWGDEGHWEALVDFHNLPGGGMDIDEFLKILR